MLNLFKVFAFLALILQGGAQNVTDPLPVPDPQPLPGPPAYMHTACGIEALPTTANTKIVDLKDQIIVRHPYLFSAKFTANGRELQDDELFNPDEMFVINVDICQEHGTPPN